MDEVESTHYEKIPPSEENQEENSKSEKVKEIKDDSKTSKVSLQIQDFFCRISQCFS